ncbi:MAG: molybdenum cofactor guanylyltransferase [Ferruginibacter sp.]
MLQKKQLYGLVACGGRSSRMGADKSLLDYHGKSQRYYIYEMLQHFCNAVFISCNELQADEVLPGYWIISDQTCYKNTGPMAALLSAFKEYPSQDFVLIGCDYPFLNESTLHHFLENCSAGKPAAFYNEQAELYEPLLAFYPASSKIILEQMFEEKKYALQFFLREADATKFIPPDTRSMISADTNETYSLIKEQLRQNIKLLK